MARVDANAFNDFSLSSSSVLSITLMNINYRWTLPQWTSQWSEKGLCNRPVFERSGLIMDSFICSKFYSSQVPKKTITSLQFWQPKLNRGWSPSFIACRYRLMKGWNIGFGKMKMVLFKGYAPIEISLSLSQYGIEWENINHFCIKEHTRSCKLYIIVKKISMQPWKLGFAKSDKKQMDDHHVNSDQDARKLQCHLYL